MNITSKFTRTTLSTVVENTVSVGKKIIVGFTLIAMVTTQAGAESFIKDAMDKYLKTSMSNVTSAKAFQTATRGVVSGGSIAVRNKIFNNDLISFVPPAFSASCNGIDMFLGSFSFINADEIVQMFRSIAANALGFLFQLALATVSAQIADLMQKFSDVVREINNLVSDSCNMAQGIVNMRNNDFSAFDRLRQSTSELTNSIRHFGDSFENHSGKISGSDAKSPTGQATKYAKKQAIDDGELGNLTWLAMVNNRADGVNRTINQRLRNLGLSDVEETIMSLTGYIIAKPTKIGGDEDKEEYDMKGKTLDLKALIEGSETQEYNLYKCDSKDVTSNPCMNPRRQTQTDVKGLAQLMYKGLCGTYDINAPCAFDSAITKLANNNNGAGGNLTTEEQAAILGLPNPYRSLVTDLQLKTVGATKIDATSSNAGELIKDDIRLLALSNIMEITDEIYTAIREQVESYKSSAKNIMLKQIAESQAALWREAEKLKLDPQYGTLENSTLKMQNTLDRYNTVPTVSPTVQTVGKTFKE